MKNTGAIWDNFESLIYSSLNYSLMNSHTFSLSSLNNEYIFPFLSTNFFFISIVWFYNFFISILLLVFCQRHVSTNEIILVPTSLLLSQILLLSLSYSRSLTPLLPFLSLFFYLFLVFSFYYLLFIFFLFLFLLF